MKISLYTPDRVGFVMLFFSGPQGFNHLFRILAVVNKGTNTAYLFYQYNASVITGTAFSLH